MLLFWNSAEGILGLQKGKISTGTFGSVTIKWLPHILRRFNQQFPHIEVTLLEGPYEGIVHWIQTRTVDVGFILKQDKMTVDFYPLKDDRLKLLLPCTHTLSGQQKVTMQQLTSNPFIMPYKGCDEHVRKLFKKQIDERLDFS
ncbi:LysR family transcriptional regulator substrate-binding protein [Aneurinibacillus sp. REN35]|uniref:LysR family transcriptional regulator substrate-binding protein n=1 Tax=Aneurinibacillus sp. REN35 TaxID=3237286 RepID=UPI003529BAC0